MAGPRRRALLIILAIRLYQVTLSPLLALFGPVCRFEPSCSRYMIGALRKYGLVRGSGQGNRPLAPLPPLAPGATALNKGLAMDGTPMQHGSERINSDDPGIRVPVSRCSGRAWEVVPEVVGVFQADREADEAGGDPLAGPLFGRLVAVAGGGGVAEGGRHVAQAGGERDVPQASG